MKKENIIELIKYSIGGVLTTGVNYLLYTLLLKGEVNYLAANAAAWVGAVLFSYYANRKLVFRSDKPVNEEFWSFVSLRFTTLLVESGLLFACVQLMEVQPMLSKILVSFVTVALNYIICKLHIFKKGVVSHG